MVSGSGFVTITAMNIGIIGAGLTGLTAAYRLSRAGYPVTVYEKSPFLGGLAHGFSMPEWSWPLEFAYHHFFTNDTALIGLVRELDMQSRILISRPRTDTYINGRIYPLDSPGALLSFPAIPFPDRLRTGILLAAMKVNPFWRPLETVTAQSLYRQLGGEAAWKSVWQPLLYGKFGDYAPVINAAWLWARVKKRTLRLGYIHGGFQALIERLASGIRDYGGTILTGAAVTRVRPVVPGSGKTAGSRGMPVSGIGFGITVAGKSYSADRILLTTPTPAVAAMADCLPAGFLAPLLEIPHLDAQILILESSRPVLEDTYWLNINDRSFPFLAVVAHTNFVDPRHYSGRHLTYIGNYLPPGHRYFSWSKDELLSNFLPYIGKINHAFTRTHILRTHLFRGQYAQPVHGINYSARAPRIHTPVPGMYLANLDSIFPWDRGTNYAVDLGNRSAVTILSQDLK